MAETYSASSLRFLQKSVDEYEKRYKMSLFLRHTTENEKAGNRFHKLIYYYLVGLDISKIVESLCDDDKKTWQKFIESGILKEKYIGVEQSFLVKVKGDVPFFLNGRFDAILEEEDYFIIYDWKSENMPKDPENDIQTVIYMYCASKLFKTEKIKIKYVSIKKLETCDVVFDKNKDYKEIIINIVSKNK